MQNKPIKIIGGGIAGLTLAAFLEKKNVPINYSNKQMNLKQLVLV